MFCRLLRWVTIAALQIQALGWPDRVDQHLPVPLQPRRRTGWTLPGPGHRGGQREGLPCLERLDSDSAVQHPPGPPSGAFASPSAPLKRWDQPGLWCGGGWRGAWFQTLGFFLIGVFSSSHSGMWGSPAGVVRVEQERLARAGTCVVGYGHLRCLPAYVFSFSKSR